jgi:2-oxoglutarate ferredoxin oxidoreductase subunit beta
VCGNTIGVAAVGCGGVLYEYLNLDIAQASHGRAPAMATGLKRACPDNIVFTYQGDGDLAAIGMAEIIHAAARGENITVIFINNAVFGMTGGQMAPTTLPNQQTTSSQKGRDIEVQGSPIRVCEMISQLDGASYVVRRSLHNYPNIRKAKKAIQQAFELQRKKQGFSLVELLSTCPTSWNMNAAEALNWIEENMLHVYPLGDYKVAPSIKEPARR